MTTDATVWKLPRSHPHLGEEEIHVWRVDLHEQHRWAALLSDMLSDHERATASRFHFPRDRDRYIVSHAAVRSILQQYLGEKTGEIRFLQNAFGKPHVHGLEVSLQFNLSHTDGVALIAVARSGAIGVDVERREPGRFDLAIARRFFSADEYSALMDLPEYQQVDAFFQCWVRKEAFIKARGTGLSFPLKHFDVTVGSDQPARLLAIRGVQERVSDWYLADLPMEPTYAAALAATVPEPLPCCWQWQPSPGLLRDTR